MKREEIGVPPSNPRNTTEDSVNITASGVEKRVSVCAVRSVAGQYGINVSIFKDWLVMKGFQVIEES